MDLESHDEVAVPSLGSGSQQTLTPLFKNKNKIFKKMEHIVSLCNQSVESLSICPTFSGVEEIFCDFKSTNQAAISDGPAPQGQSQTKYSKDYRDRKELYIQFLEKKIMELLDHINFIRKTQQTLIQHFYERIVIYAEKLEADRDLILRRLNRSHDASLFELSTPLDWNIVTTFEGRQVGLRKKVLEGTFQTLINYSVPKLLHYMANALNFEGETENGASLQISKVGFDMGGLRQEISGQKGASDKILIDIAHLKNKIDDHLSRFDQITSKLVVANGKVNVPFFQKMVEIERPHLSLEECPFVDQKTRGILKYFAPLCA